ncbi:uncharacterized protein DS421_1g12650 [Arachis hypogaea]|nr:uncharacterized protein DS421_1g12650 [Arachis hypogaea]
MIYDGIQILRNCGSLHQILAFCPALSLLLIIQVRILNFCCNFSTKCIPESDFYLKLALIYKLEFDYLEFDFGLLIQNLVFGLAFNN